MSEWTDFPECPFCKAVERDVFEIDLPGLNNGSVDLSCNSCGQDYVCEYFVHTTYRTKQP